METAADEGKLVEAAICYTGDIEDPTRTKYDLAYYVRLAKELQRRGAHIFGIKDMAGLLRPYAAGPLVKALKEETGLPVHLHTHDSSGNAAATVLAAVEAGVDAVDLAIAVHGGRDEPAESQRHRRCVGASSRAARVGFASAAGVGRLLGGGRGLLLLLSK